jgi:hypothetical protein
MKYIVIIGSPISRFEYIGPFDDVTSALNFARKKYGDNHWWIEEIKDPNDNTSIRSEMTTALRWTAEGEDKGLCKIVEDYLAGKKIRHKDGNPRNYSLENLELVPIKDSHFEVHDIPEQTQRLDWWIEHQKIMREIQRNDYDEFENDIDTADTDSYASSLPGIDNDVLRELRQHDENADYDFNAGVNKIEDV